MKEGEPLNARKIKKLIKKNKHFNKNKESLFVIQFTWKEDKEKGD